VKNREAVHSPANVPSWEWSARDIPVFEQLLETARPDVQPWMDAVDRRRLARLHETRRAVQAQLAMLKRAYKAAELREPAVPADASWFRPLQVCHVAKKLGVARRTVRWWIARGWLRARSVAQGVRAARRRQPEHGLSLGVGALDAAP
jgi:hypothetical protein